LMGLEDIDFHQLPILLLPEILVPYSFFLCMIMRFTACPNVNTLRF
jgi:hypothetical protein